MTGKGHRLTGVGAAFLAAAAAHLTGLPQIPAAAVALFSCTMPDWIEFPIYRNGQRTGQLIVHRTITHWPFLWLALALWGVQNGTFIGAMAVGAAMGSFTHILGDAPNPMGIPWLWPTKRLKIGKKGLWRSGQHEALIIVAYTAFGVGMWHFASLTGPLGMSVPHLPGAFHLPGGLHLPDAGELRRALDAIRINKYI